MQDMVDNYVQGFTVCNEHNPKQDIQVSNERDPGADAPLKDITIDFTDMRMENRVRGYRYLLVMVDRFTRWVEAIPCSQQNGSQQT